MRGSKPFAANQYIETLLTFSSPIARSALYRPKLNQLRNALCLQITAGTVRFFIVCVSAGQAEKAPESGFSLELEGVLGSGELISSR